MTIEHKIREFILQEEFYRSDIQQINISAVLKLAMTANYEHDLALQEYFQTVFLNEQQTWVITQYQIKLYEPVQAGDRMWLDTRIIDINSFFVTRRYGIYRESLLVAEVYVQFTRIDIQRRKMVRFTYEINILDQIIDSAYQVNFHKLRRLDESQLHSDTQIEMQEAYFDRNQHVNNLVYLELAFNQFSPAWFRQHRIQEINVKYEKEILAQEEVRLQVLHDDAKRIIQLVYLNMKHDKVACIIEIHWR